MSSETDVGHRSTGPTDTRTVVAHEDSQTGADLVDSKMLRQNESVEKSKSKKLSIYKPFKTSVCEFFKTIITSNLENLRAEVGRRCVLVLPTINDFAYRILKHVVLSFSELEILEVRSSSEPLRLGIYDKLCFARSGRNQTLAQIVAEASKTIAPTTDRRGRGRTPDCFMYVPPALRTQRADLSVNIKYNGWYWPVVKQPEPDQFWTKLSRKQIQELHNLAGSGVAILKPTWEDIGFDIQLTVERERVSHMVEVYNSDFPIGCDVKRSIRTYFPHHENYNAYRIDQHHALLVFCERTGPEICSEIVWKHGSRFRPVPVASKLTKMEVLNNTDIITPGSRGQSSASVANRMIRKSLGIKDKGEHSS